MTKSSRISLLIFCVVILVIWISIAGAYDSFHFSVPFLLGSLTIIITSFVALLMGLLAGALPPIKAVGWIMGSLAVELFVPLILVIYIKFSPNLLVNSEDLVIILKYFLAFFPVCLFLEKALVLREFNQNQHTEVKQ